MSITWIREEYLENQHNHLGIKILQEHSTYLRVCLRILATLSTPKHYIDYLRFLHGSRSYLEISLLKKSRVRNVYAEINDNIK